MNKRFLCSFTRDDLELIIFSLQQAAEDLFRSGEFALWGQDNTVHLIQTAHAQKLQALAAVINRAVDNSEE